MKIGLRRFSLFLSVFCFFCLNAYAVELNGVTVTSSSLKKSPGVRGGVIEVFTKSRAVSGSKGYKIISSRIEKSPGVQGGVINIPVVKHYVPQDADAWVYVPNIHTYVDYVNTLSSSHDYNITNNTDKIKMYGITLKLQRANGQYVDYKITVQVDAHRSYYGQKKLYMNGVVYNEAGTYNIYGYTDISGESSSHAKDTGHATVSNTTFLLQKIL